MLSVGHADPGAKAAVESLHAALLTAMRDARTLGFDGRRQQLAPVIERSFDFPFISSLVTGRHWRSFDADQRTLMIETFTRLTVATYAARFDDHDGEEFKFVSLEPKQKDRFLVRSRIVDADGDSVQLDYLLHRVDGAWKMINVIANGVSDLSIKRAEYSSILEDEGFATLIARLNEQIAGYESGE